jgi:hypothetical protein
MQTRIDFLRFRKNKRPDGILRNAVIRLFYLLRCQTIIIIIAALSFLSILFLVSCSDKNSSNTNQNGPTAIFDVIPVNNSFHALDTLLFDASRSRPGNSTIRSYYWDFTDNTQDSGITCCHVYDYEGQYSVSLIVADELGLVDTCHSTVTVWSPFARTDYKVSVISEPSFPGPRFHVFVESYLDYFPSGDYNLNVDLREVDGSDIVLVADREATISIDTSRFVSIDTLEYNSAAGFWWPDSSAMLILNLWLNRSRVAVDSLIVTY